MRDILLAKTRQKYQTLIDLCDDLFSQVEALVEGGYYVAAREIHQQYRAAYEKKVNTYSLLLRM